MNVSIVSVSRFASRPHRGQTVRYQEGCSLSGLYSGGSSTGSCSAGTGTTPSTGQYTTGIGAPQYRCLEISQSRSRYFTARLPTPCASSQSQMRSTATDDSSPENSPLFTSAPGPRYGSRSTPPGPHEEAMTSRNGRAYRRAEPKTPPACAGPALIAPAPYLTSRTEEG